VLEPEVSEVVVRVIPGEPVSVLVLSEEKLELPVESPEAVVWKWELPVWDSEPSDSRLYASSVSDSDVPLPASVVVWFEEVLMVVSIPSALK
jgi:hypothetical protein